MSGAWPIVGHLLKLGDDHASVCEKWWRQQVSHVPSRETALTYQIRS